MPSELTPERLREVLDYDPETGVFRRRKSGRRAGCLAPHGYVFVYIDGKQQYAHRLAWLYVYGNWPPKFIDHANMNRADNRLSNLRSASRAQNQQNSGISRANTSGRKGVSWNSYMSKWKATVYRERKQYHLGYHDTIEEAHASYCRAATELHGEFARTA